VGGSTVVVNEVHLPLLGERLLPVWRERTEGVESVVGHVVRRVGVTRVGAVGTRPAGLGCTRATAWSLWTVA
jgi:hypothetical protein